MIEPSITPGDLEYELPAELVAQSPPAHRDDSRMLIVSRSADMMRNAAIRDLPQQLHPGDLLVLNDTRVLPARFTAARSTGGRVHGLFLEESLAGQWLVMLEGSRRLRVGEVLLLGTPPAVVVITLRDRLDEGQWHVEVDSNQPAATILEHVGRTPLPPYIARKRSALDSDPVDRTRYQTVYARSPGAVAAPTAGLHLTEELLARIRRSGVHLAFVTLHVGAGTFKPIATPDLAAHPMHYERFSVEEETIADCRNCRRRGGRIVAVGTTVVRVLESVLGEGRDASVRSGSTNLFIYPPYRITAVDALLTNFHLPRSTLLALVMAFAGVDLTRRIYAHAIAARYRFYSYGDAMLLE